MKLVFLGTPQAAVPSLRALLEAGHDVPLVVTQPDRPVGRSKTPQASPVKREAISQGLAVAQPERVRGGALSRLLEPHAPDLLVVVAYGRLLPPDALARPVHGAVNAHFSLLPEYRGAAPVQWALAHGAARTGVTTMRIVETLDAGPILLQREVAIAPGEHAPALEARLAAVAGALLVTTIERIGAGTIESREQDHTRATLAPRLERADGALDLGLTAREIEGRVRGFDPWPGVWAHCRSRRVRISEARALDVPAEAEAGTVLDVVGREGVRIACAGQTSLLIAVVQPEGRRPMPALDALHGRILSPGDRLTSDLERGTSTAEQPGPGH